MDKIFIVLGAIVVTYVLVKLLKRKTLHPHIPFKYNFGKRRDTFAKVLELLHENNAKVLLETGTSRNGLKNTKGDGAATIVFGLWAKKNSAKLYSVDIDPISVQESEKEVKNQNLSEYVNVVLSDSVTYLKDFEQNIDFLYLDSYDYSEKDEDIQKKSQEHHLNEFKAIENKLHDKTVVLIDDCKLKGGGKGRLVIDYMLKNNWKILMDKYQVLLVKSN
ncbi:class I SAM-dependent methyltransferase [Tenacibaculum jejuense]|uniref:Class I SAM-dependent methyltransferase n=1 Tax=Tenacibaculum jejuense TaxID=584609 RepID=A0A238UB83_9FLAO|nr:class I SAM-dependent methyltransferase [Tenacibaculum jejuense]SNR15670.1 protein of unknown function [Tenacibaculum jejuense]